MGTMGMMLSVVKQSFFGPPGQYGRLVNSYEPGYRAIVAVFILECKMAGCWDLDFTVFQ